LWSYETGLPAKTGVGGGIFVVVPGVLAVAAFSPPLDTHGNSVRAQLAIDYIGEMLGLNLFTEMNKRKVRRQRKATRADQVTATTTTTSSNNYIL